MHMPILRCQFGALLSSAADINMPVPPISLSSPADSYICKVLLPRGAGGRATCEADRHQKEGAGRVPGKVQNTHQGATPTPLQYSLTVVGLLWHPHAAYTASGHVQHLVDQEEHLDSLASCRERTHRACQQRLWKAAKAARGSLCRPHDLPGPSVAADRASGLQLSVRWLSCTGWYSNCSCMSPWKAVMRRSRRKLQS